MDTVQEFSVSLKLEQDYQFLIDFGEFGDLLSDEPEPLGQGEGPNPSRLLAASVANCLAASLLFAVRKFKEDPGEISATAKGFMTREDGRWRITKLEVSLNLEVKAEDLSHLERVLSQFEDFCVVTQSVRQGIHVEVSVVDVEGKALLI